MADHIVDRSLTNRATKGRMLRADAVAELLDLPRKRVYLLARDGIIPHIRVGRQVRFSAQELEAWIAAGGAGYPGGEE